MLSSEKILARKIFLSQNIEIFAFLHVLCVFEQKKFFDRKIFSTIVFDLKFENVAFLGKILLFSKFFSIFEIGSRFHVECKKPHVKIPSRSKVIRKSFKNSQILATSTTILNVIFSCEILLFSKKVFDF